jgi:hypothetical protein
LLKTGDGAVPLPDIEIYAKLENLDARELIKKIREIDWKYAAYHQEKTKKWISQK